MAGPSGYKTLLKLILAKTDTIDTSVVTMNSDLTREIKFNQDKLEDVEKQLEVMNKHLAEITGDVRTIDE